MRIASGFFLCSAVFVSIGTLGEILKRNEGPWEDRIAWKMWGW